MSFLNIFAACKSTFKSSLRLSDVIVLDIASSLSFVERTCSGFVLFEGWLKCTSAMFCRISCFQVRLIIVVVQDRQLMLLK